MSIITNTNMFRFFRLIKVRALSTCLFLVMTTALSGVTCIKHAEKERDGVVRRFHANGKVLAEITYKNGKKNGVFKSWYDNGQLHEESYYENDSLVGQVISYYKNGKKNYEHYWNKVHNFDSLSLFWYEDGTLGDSGRYENGNLQGEWKRFYKSGMLQYIRNYTRGQLDGKCISFKENGDTLKVELYRSGELIESKDY